MGATYRKGDVDLMVVPVTSKSSRVAYDVALTDWPQGGLKLPSVVRTEKLATVEKSAIVRAPGKLSARDRNALEAELAVVFREIVPLTSAAG